MTKTNSFIEYFNFKHKDTNQCSMKPLSCYHLKFTNKIFCAFHNPHIGMWQLNLTNRIIANQAFLIFLNNLYLSVNGLFLLLFFGCTSFCEYYHADKGTKIECSTPSLDEHMFYIKSKMSFYLDSEMLLFALIHLVSALQIGCYHHT